jgi:hypothetical protein
MEMTLDELTSVSSFIAPDVILECSNVDEQIRSMQERMMTIKLNEQGQADYDAWLENAKRIQAQCQGTSLPTDTPAEPPVPLVKKPTTLQPVLILLGLVVGGVIIYNLLKSKNETN